MGRVNHPGPMSHGPSGTTSGSDVGSDPRRDAQGKRWCITAYNEEDVAWIKDSCPVAYCCAREEGGMGGKTHYQIYAKWNSNRRWTWFQRNAIKNANGGYDLYWVLATGPEWKCRRYIVDVESYLKSPDCTHQKTQGVVLDDFGCEVMLDEQAPQDQRIVKACVDGAPLWQIFRDNPMYYYHNRRKIVDLHGDITGWREQGLEIKPRNYNDYVAYKSKRRKVEDKPDVEEA